MLLENYAKITRSKSVNTRCLASVVHHSIVRRRGSATPSLLTESVLFDKQIMEAFIKEFEAFQIPLEKIIAATNNFHKTKRIGFGGFGRVYSGKLSHFKGSSKVAIKRLHRKFGQGDLEFWEEIRVLTRHKHDKLIALMGFCIENGERILVYEYASNRSLNHYLRSSVLTWSSRLKIGLDVAMGVSYLHDATGTKETIIHADIKTSNVLLDADWNAIVADLGLSKTVPGKQMGLITKHVGTAGYVCPVFLKTFFLTNKSDVYSFGVLLLEMLCGKLCYDIDERNGEFHSFVPMWQESYAQNKLQEIIFDYLKQQIDEKSLKIYADIAFRCLHENPEERPTMPDVVKVLETALIYQKLYERVKQPTDHLEMVLTAADPMNDRSESELEMLLLKGILVNNGKTWFSRNINGDHCEMISIAACLTSTANDAQHYVSLSEYSTRFAVGCYEPSGAKFKTHVRTQFLSPHIKYLVNLVFKVKKNEKQYMVNIVHKLQGEKRTSYSFLSGEREDGWLTAELCRFTSHQRAVDLEIMFYTKCCPNLLVEGIEFLPENNVHMQSMSDKETFWKEKLPEDYKEIIKWSKDHVRWETTKDLYNIFCRGFLLNDGEQWFFLDDDGKKCVMVPARMALEEDEWNWKFVTESRFEVADYNCEIPKSGIFCKFGSKLLSPQTTYGAYLVYKLPEGCELDVSPPPVQVVDKDSHPKEVHNIFLQTPHLPVISCNAKNKAFYPSNRPKMRGLPKLRSDGWMEVQVREFQTRLTMKMISTHLSLSSNDMGLQGLTVQCLEFRPV